MSKTGCASFRPEYWLRTDDSRNLNVLLTSISASFLLFLLKVGGTGLAKR
jgi:hypothetical protein